MERRGAGVPSVELGASDQNKPLSPRRPSLLQRLTDPWENLQLKDPVLPKSRQQRNKMRARFVSVTEQKPCVLLFNRSPACELSVGITGPQGWE